MLVSNVSKYLVVVPNSDVGKLQYLVDNYSSTTEPDIEVVKHDVFVKNQKVKSTLGASGIMLIDPAQRLVKAFNAASENTTDTLCFRTFYSNPARVNFYAKLFKQVDISEFGFIGLQSHFYKSTLLYSDWLNVQLYRLPYNTITSQAKPLSISVEDQKEIRQLYAEDYKIYEQVKALFFERWKAYSEKVTIDLTDDKRALVHVGPPKTGTSAIQAWLNASSDKLLKEGIYYPDHGADKNGVSSGNFEHLVSFTDNDRRGYFDDEKLISTVHAFNESGCHTLLLSSEHFYYYLIWLFTRLQSAEFVFYIRHPLATAESGFHQEVKRHKRTEPFKIPQDIGFNNLLFISELAKEFNCKIHYRYFNQCLFKNGSLLDDFASCIPTKVSPPKTVQRLNTQYSPGAIALMRLCNKFADDKLLCDLDTYLQMDSEQQASFSFISKEAFDTAQEKIGQQVATIAKQNPGLDADKLSTLVDCYECPPSCSPDAVRKDLTRLLSGAPIGITRQLYLQARNRASSNVRKEIIRGMKLSWLRRLFYSLTESASTVSKVK